MKIPRFYRWGGGGVPYFWCFGWDNENIDLVCVKAKVTTDIEGEIALSPTSRSMLLALLGFGLKAILIRIDDNLKGLKG